jgi:glycosyltransferase 2 family protein
VSPIGSTAARDTPRSPPVPVAHARERIRTWRLGTFGPASEEPYRRRPSDYLRVGVAVLVVAATCLHQGDLTETEHDLFLLFNRLPDSLQSLFEVVYGAGALWAVGLLVAAAFLARRRRLSRDLAVSAFVAWSMGRLLGAIVGGHETLGEGLKVLIRLDDGPSYPVVRLAVVTAVICAAAPYVTRPVRRVGQGLVLCLALAALYLGTGFPNDVFAAAVLGWGVAAAVHLVFGSPGGRPTRAQVTDALAELGLDVDGMGIAPYTREDGTVMYAHDDTGRVRVRVLGRDEADAQLLSKLGRFLMYKNGGSQVHLTRLEDVQQEAFALLLAERAGARVPSVLVVGSAGPGTAVLATRVSDGRRLVDVAPTELTDEILRAVWAEVRLLHGAGVAHGRLNAAHVVPTTQGPAIVDFVDASYGADDVRRRADIAELLVSLATLIGNDRAVTTPFASLGADTLAGALPYLQSPALSADTRPLKPRDRKALQHRLSDLRSLVASTAGVDEPALQQLYRVNATNFLMAVGALVAVFALLSQIGDPGEFWRTISAANWWWLLLALALSLATSIPSAVALIGTVPQPLPLWRTSELQLSMSFSNLAVPAVGGMASQVRFLQKQGVDLASAVAAGVVLSTAANLSTSRS